MTTMWKKKTWIARLVTWRILSSSSSSPACHCIRQHKVRIRQHTPAYVSILLLILSPAYVSISQHTSAYVSIRQHTSAYVNIRQHTSTYVSTRQHTSAYVSIRQHTSKYVSIRQHTSAYVSIRQHTHALLHAACESTRANWRANILCEPAYVSIREHMSAYVSMRPHTSVFVSIR
jgi:hypothetical protein